MAEIAESMGENTSDTGSLGTVGEHRIRLTEADAQLNLRTVLELCAAGELRCSERLIALGGDRLHRGLASCAWRLLP